MRVESERSKRAVFSRRGGEPVFLVAGQDASGEFRCSECGYGVIVRNVLPACPMCRGSVWEEPAASSFYR
jgi:rubrerythrin